ncbi:peroxiredoxin-2E-1, chloroplastic-like [Salvia splendens]|uniref:peroxiredoxin-2E-1, chloroplastic-like n=1 Tax=Salvia splendens TaxID=180675 RepID=UPI001C278659|nr:peroxiredoxin-2E-1, chloroplastic-like [Salvia splendens]
MAAATASTASFSSAHLFHSSSLNLKQPLSLSFPNHRRRFPSHPLRFSAAPKISAIISVGDKLPDATLSYLDASDELQTVSIADLTANKKAILVAVPGAFTPTCSQKHLPGFVEKAAEFRAKGVDTVACVSVNDTFVMKAWKADLKIGEEVLLLSDGNGDFTRAIGCELDLSDKPIGLGVRSRRYAMFVEDGVVKVLNLEDGGAFNVSSAEDLLKAV